METTRQKPLGRGQPYARRCPTDHGAFGHFALVPLDCADATGGLTVRRYRADGSIEEVLTWEDPRIEPDGLTVDANGDLVIATLNSGGFHIISPDGSEQTLVDLGGTTLSNITFGPGGSLYATDLGTKPAATQDKVYFGRVFKIDSERSGMPMFRGEISLST